MGAVWLGSIPHILREAGLDVIEWPGWETRSRSSGGYDKVLGIGVHNDAAPAGTSLANRLQYAWGKAPDRPIGAVWVHTNGVWCVGAAGATNTQGRGGPYPTSKGTIPKDQGNKFILSVEASNNGAGEPWPVVQQNSMVRGVGALCKWLTLDPLSDVMAHFEWTDPGESILVGSKRKVDPAGPSRYAVPNAVYPNMWDMTHFRRDVLAMSGIAKPLPPVPEDNMPTYIAVPPKEYAGKPNGYWLVISEQNIRYCNSNDLAYWQANGLPFYQFTNDPMGHQQFRTSVEVAGLPWV